MDGFRPATVDESPGLDCPNAPNTSSDVAAYVKNGILELVANVNNRPGVYVNAISNHDLNYAPGRYTVTGQFRLLTPDQAEIIGLNLNYVRDWYEHPIIFGWVTNPWNELYGDIIIKIRDGSIITTHSLEVDTKWHTFELVGDFLPDGAKYHSLTIDGFTVNIDRYTLKVKKPWRSGGGVALETSNLWPSCDGRSVYRAITHWDNIRVSREPLK